MTTETTSVAPKFLMPRDANAVGPQNEAERQLYELVMKGIHSGPSPRAAIVELTGELRAHVHAKR